MTSPAINKTPTVMTATHIHDHLMTVNWQLRLNTPAGSTWACSCAYSKCISFAMTFTDQAEDNTLLMTTIQKSSIRCGNYCTQENDISSYNCEFVSYRKSCIVLWNCWCFLCLFVCCCCFCSEPAYPPTSHPMRIEVMTQRTVPRWLRTGTSSLHQVP